MKTHLLLERELTFLCKAVLSKEWGLFGHQHMVRGEDLLVASASSIPCTNTTSSGKPSLRRT